MTNILVIVADDMRLDHLPYLPTVRRVLQGQGRTFTGARCNVALCQPNRVGLFTGQLSRDHGELGIGYGATVFTDHDNTLGPWVADAGYRTGLFGKYVNFWDGPWPSFEAPEGTRSRRPGGLGHPRTRRVGHLASADQLPHRRRLGRPGTGRRAPQDSGTFQTDYLAEEARSFIDDPGPWFCYLAPQQPHSPFAPHPRDLHAWSQARCRQVPVPDATAKPPWVKDALPISDTEWSLIQQDFRGRLRELAAVDRMVGEVVGLLRESGQLDDTVIVFTSDNGVHQGEQRRGGDGTKAGPYDVGLRVPMVVRGPGFEPGPAIDVPIYPMQDLTATVLDIAGGERRAPHQAGISLRTLATDPEAHRERILLHGIGAQGFGITGDGITTGPHHSRGHRKLFRYPSVLSELGPPWIYELYDLAADPDELVNLADEPAHRAARDALERELLDLLEA